MSNRKPYTLPSSVIYCFFALGIISAIAFRAIIVFQRLEPSWVRPVGYIGVIVLWFFFYRYYISFFLLLVIATIVDIYLSCQLIKVD